MRCNKLFEREKSLQYSKIINLFNRLCPPPFLNTMLRACSVLNWPTVMQISHDREAREEREADFSFIIFIFWNAIYNNNRHVNFYVQVVLSRFTMQFFKSNLPLRNQVIVLKSHSPFTMAGVQYCTHYMYNKHAIKELFNARIHK